MEKKVEMARMRISRTGICNKKVPSSKFQVPSKNQPEMGFTLLELIVVMFIISIVMALIFPSFAGFGESKLKSESREIASILRYMNDSAVSRKETFSMKFDLDEGTVYWVGPDGEKTKRFDDMTGVTTQSKGKVSDGEITLFFGPLGIQENISVHMGKGDKGMTITLNHLSGRIKITQNSK
ncbi:MAG: prepilin-type N-terminal cleavage/methylation domain-containing protein [Nitrospirota bacterium]